MVSRSEGYLVLYPIYFDARKTRAQGRRVRAAHAVEAPTAKAVFEAAKAAGLSPVLEDEHHHPSSWFERTGRVLLPAASVGSKGEAILKVALNLPAAHAAVPQAATSKPHKAHKGKFSHKKRGRRRR
jgi:signal recognition particle subunit SRP19